MIASIIDRPETPNAFEATEKTNSNTTKMPAFSRNVKRETLGKYIDNRRDAAGDMARLLADDE